MNKIKEELDRLYIDLSKKWGEVHQIQKDLEEITDSDLHDKYNNKTFKIDNEEYDFYKSKTSIYKDSDIYSEPLYDCYIKLYLIKKDINENDKKLIIRNLSSDCWFLESERHLESMYKKLEYELTIDELISKKYNLKIS